MQNNSKTEYDKLANKMICIDDKFSEIEPLIKTLNIWVKENYFELIPVINILNCKINDMAEIIKK